MNNLLEQIQQEKNSRICKLKSTLKSINEKTEEIEETKIAYAKAELNEDTKLANTLFASMKSVEMDIEQLNSRKELLEKSNICNNEKLIDLAEKLKQQNYEGMKQANELKNKLRLDLSLLDDEYNRNRIENGKARVKCDNDIFSLANEIAQVVDYIDSYSTIEKEIISKFGSDRIIRFAGLSI